VEMTPVKQPTNYPLRLAEAVREAIRRKAADERRSVNRQIEMALFEDLVRSGYLSPPQRSEGRRIRQ
jgi:hypothetical protein